MLARKQTKISDHREGTIQSNQAWPISKPDHNMARDPNPIFSCYTKPDHIAGRESPQSTNCSCNAKPNHIIITHYLHLVVVGEDVARRAFSVVDAGSAESRHDAAAAAAHQAPHRVGEAPEQGGFHAGRHGGVRLHYVHVLGDGLRDWDVRQIGNNDDDTSVAKEGNDREGWRRRAGWGEGF